MCSRSSFRRLRERATEIPLLFRHFLDKYSEKFGKPSIAPSKHLLDAACELSVARQLRELENFVKRYVILEDDEGSLRELVEMSARASAPRLDRKFPFRASRDSRRSSVASKTKPKWKPLPTRLRRRVGAERTPPRCSASVTRRCCTRCGSSISIRLERGVLLLRLRPKKRRQWARCAANNRESRQHFESFFAESPPALNPGSVGFCRRPSPVRTKPHCAKFSMA